MSVLSDRARRRLLVQAAVLATPLARTRNAQASPSPAGGWLQPRLPVPDWHFLAADGQRRALRQVLAGKVTAVQLMFAGCTTSCPPQGALFGAVAERMAPARCQLLSLSIDTLGDTPASVKVWQARFGQYPGWQVGIGET